MNDLNKVLISGNLVRDPEFRDVAGGLQVCGLRIAVNRRYADRQGAKKEEVSFIDVEYFVGGSDDAYGRPVGVVFDRQGALLVADDVGNVIWRVAPTK